MKLQKYLINEARSKEISVDSAIKLAPKFSDAIKSFKDGNNVMMRGLQVSFMGGYPDTGDYRGDYAYIQPSKYERRSAYASGNHYTLLLDNLPSWKKYPKRSRSVICSTDRWKANEYKGSGLYYVLPKNGAMIGVCPRTDIFESFSDIWSLGAFTSACNGEDISDKSWSAMIESMNDFDQQVIDNREKYDDDTITLSSFAEVITNFVKQYEKHKRLMLVIAHIFDPDYNNFKLIKSGGQLPSNREVWTSDDCLLVESKFMNDFMDSVK